MSKNGDKIITDGEFTLSLLLIDEGVPANYYCRITVSDEEVKRNKDMRKLLEIKMYEGVDDILELLFKKKIVFPLKGLS